MKVIGVDVGPGKGGHVCIDGSLPEKRDPKELSVFLEQLSGAVLPAWDAPLTGPPDVNAWTDDYDLTTRRIERFFMRGGEYKAPTGISVRCYSGCSHWTISQRLLGLPRIGPYSAMEKGLPFELVTNDQGRPLKGRHVVEVHPAVALWLWCREEYEAQSSMPVEERWKYKTNKCVRAQLAKIISRRIKRSHRIGDCLEKAGEDVDDDILDACVAWYLGRQWLDGEGVMLLGDARTGSFLVPKDERLKEQFDEFCEQETARRCSTPPKVLTQNA